MPGQRGFQTVTHDELYHVKICPSGDQWVVKIAPNETLSPKETAVDTHEHTLASLDSAKEWVAEQLAKVWLPAIEEHHDLRKYEDLTWTPIDC